MREGDAMGDDERATTDPTDPTDTRQEDLIEAALPMEDWATAAALVAYGAFAALLEETIRRACNPELVEDRPDFHEDLDPLLHRRTSPSACWATATTPRT
jgi:hypothetical protein